MAVAQRGKGPRPTSKRRSGRPGGRPVGRPQKATARDWIGGARLRTLTLGVVPVVLGTAVAYVDGGYDLGIALLCLAVALFLQIGVNYSNDYSDGVRGRCSPSR